MITPLVSVLMTVYNREKYIAEAIESVLASTYTNFELIIVDDCSKDDSVAIAQSYARKDSRIRLYVNELNLGDYANRNRAASYATGKYLKYLDSDDMIMPWGLEIMVYCMESEPDVAIGFSANRHYNVKYPIKYTPREAYRQYYFYNYLLSIGPTGTIIKGDIFNALGGFSGKQFIGDSEFWLKIAKQFSVLSLPPNLTYWREHEGQQIVEEKKNFQIEASRFKMDKLILSSEDCPLLPIESKIAIRNIKNIKCRNLFMQFVKGSFFLTIKKKQLLGLTMADFIFALKRNKVPR